MAEFSMDKYHGWDFVDSEKVSFPKYSAFSDEWITDDGLKGQKRRSHPVFDKNSATAYVAIIKEGIEHTQKSLLNFKISF